MLKSRILESDRQVCPSVPHQCCDLAKLVFNSQNHGFFILKMGIRFRLLPHSWLQYLNEMRYFKLLAKRLHMVSTLYIVLISFYITFVK